MSGKEDQGSTELPGTSDCIQGSLFALSTPKHRIIICTRPGLRVDRGNALIGRLAPTNGTEAGGLTFSQSRHVKRVLSLHILCRKEITA